MIAQITRLKKKAITGAAALGLLLAVYNPSPAQAGFEDLYLDNYLYYYELYAIYGYDYYTYYLGLALPSYNYYLGLYYSGYHSVYSDPYGGKADIYSSGAYVFDYYMGIGDFYFLNYY